MVTGVLLAFVTLGVYGLYWLYSIGQDLRLSLERDDLVPGLDVLLFVLCFPLYAIYWAWRTGGMVAEVRRRAGLEQRPGLTVLATMLSCFGLSVVTLALYQDALNEVAAR